MEDVMNICVKNDNLMLVDGKLYRAFPFTACGECAFSTMIICCNEANCSQFLRKDCKKVLFKQVQKVSLFEYTSIKVLLPK